MAEKDSLDSFEAEIAGLIDAQRTFEPIETSGAGGAARMLPAGHLVDGRYEIEGLLGQGGFGVVYAARQLSTGQRVAIKALHATATANPTRARTALSRFEREMALIARLGHPNIVRLLDSGVLEEGRPFSVLEYIEGRSLAEVLHDDGPLDVAETRQLMLQVLDALACAHDLGVVHRDLKPHNIMVADTGARRHARVLDFGISAVVQGFREGDYETLTQDDGFCGTPPYMAPEQLRDKDVTPQSDIYAWGLVFLECVQGQPVFAASSSAEIIYAQMSDEPVALPEPLVGTAIGALLERAVAKPLDARHSSARALYDLLESCDLSDLQTQPSRPRLVPVFAAAAITIILLVGAIIAATHHFDSATPNTAPTAATDNTTQAPEPPAPEPDAARTWPHPLVTIPERQVPIGIEPDRLKALRKDFPQNAVDLYEGTGVLPYEARWPSPALSVAASEVTRADWETLEVAQAAASEPCEGAAQPAGKPSDPVSGVGALEAERFCKALEMRLPTAQEWEGLARGSSGRLYGFTRAGDSPPTLLSDAQIAALQTPGRAPASLQTPEGLEGLTGGVSEWVTCQSDALEYCVDGFAHRGGSWRFATLFEQPEPALLLAPLFGVLGEAPGCLRRPDIGFRCVKDTKTPKSH